MSKLPSQFIFQNEKTTILYIFNSYINLHGCKTVTPEVNECVIDKHVVPVDIQQNGVLF